jgi:hypothetical protein
MVGRRALRPGQPERVTLTAGTGEAGIFRDARCGAEEFEDPVRPTGRQKREGAGPTRRFAR